MQTSQNNHNTIASSSPSIPNIKGKKFNGLLSMLPFGLGNKKPVVAVLRLEGVIGKVSSIKSGLTLNSLNKLIEKTFEINDLDCVCLVINSPGGSPVQAEMITNRIINLAKEKEIPVYSFVEDVAASGGYWLACAATKIYASRSSIIGSIGVISSGFGFHNAIEKIGIERRVYTEGKSKSVLDPFQPAKESDIKIIQKIQREIHEHFVSTVKTRRGGQLTQTDEILFNGEFWSGQTAISYGLVDGIDDVYSFVNNKFEGNAKIVHMEQKKSWFKKKFGIRHLSKIFASDIADSLTSTVETKLQDSKFKFK